MYHNSLCEKCGLWKDAKHPCVIGRGDPSAKLLILGEALGCISGDSLIEVAYRDKAIYPNGIPIRDLVGKKDFKVYSYDIETKSLVLGNVEKVWSTGIKKVYKVTYEWSFDHINIKQDSIIVTSNHPFLLRPVTPGKRDPYKGINDGKDTYKSIDTGLSVGHSLQPFNRNFNGTQSLISIESKQAIVESRFLLSNKLGRKLKDKTEHCHHIDRNHLNDSYDNIQEIDIKEHAILHMKEDGSHMYIPEIREKHRQVMSSTIYKKKMSLIMHKLLQDPIMYKKRLEQIQDTNSSRSSTVKQKHNDPEYYYKYIMGRAKSSKFKLTEEEAIQKFKEKFPYSSIPPVYNHKIVSIEYIGEQEVYDMEVQKYHNFATQGIFVHNSEEDLQGLPFVGSSGQRLQAYLDRLNIKYYISNAVKCRPTSKSLNRKGETILHNRTPTAKEIKLCSAKTYQLIDKIKPTVILTLGSIPVTQLLHLGLSMTSVRGRTYYHPQLECHIVPTWHPAYLGYSGDKLVEKQFMQDLHQAIELLKAPRVRQINSNPRSLQDPVEIKEYLEYLNTIEECAIDLETTGLNPRKDRITDISLCAKCGEGVHIRWIDILPYFECLKKLLEKPGLKCIFQNGKFDTAFLKAIGINVANFYFDTQLAYHTTTMTFEGEGKSLYSLEVMSWLLTREGNYKAILEEFGGIAGHQNGIQQKKAEKKEKEIKKEQEKKEEKKKEQKSEKTKQVIRVPVVECNSLFDDMAEPVVKTNIANEYFSHLSTEEDGKFLEKFTPAKKLRRTLLEEDPNIFIINEEQEKELQPYITFVSDKLKRKLELTQLDPLQYYSAMDADVTYQIYKRLKPQIDAEFKDVFYNLIMPLCNTLGRLEENGILLDVPYIDSLLEQNKQQSADIKDKFFKKVKREFNLDSAKELREIIYDHLKIPVEEEYMTAGGKSGIKHPSTDKHAIEYLAKKHPILKGIVEYRKLEKENSTYLEGFKNHIDPVTHRIHSSFLQHATATGRLASSSPNTQNIPRDNRIRNMIIPREGYKFVTADLSQAELRILAMMADDRKMIDAFASGYDFHSYTACTMFNIDPKIFDKDNNKDHNAKRSLAKNINFGIAYQMSANSLAADVNIPLKEAQDFIDKFYNTYSNVKRWIDRTKSFALKNGYVETLYGRRRYLPYVHSSDQRIREGALRQAVNTPIQGTASDCACFGLIRIQKFIDEKQLKTKPIMIIHDEIVLETPFEEVDLMVEKLPYFMTQNLPKVTIPLVADAEVLTRWKK